MARAKILVVEDEGIVAINTKLGLERMGYKVCGVAPSCRRAMELAAKHHPDLVLMDIKLRGKVDGIETAGKLIRKYDMSVIYLTAHSNKETRKKAEYTHPLAFIKKPVNDRELFDVIEEVFEGK